MEDVLGVGPGKVGGEGNLEGTVNGGIGGVRRAQRWSSLRRVLRVGVHVHGYVGVGSAHDEIGADSFTPLPHISQLVHNGRKTRVAVGRIGTSRKRGPQDPKVARGSGMKKGGRKTKGGGIVRARMEARGTGERNEIEGKRSEELGDERGCFPSLLGDRDVLKRETEEDVRVGRRKKEEA